MAKWLKFAVAALILFVVLAALAWRYCQHQSQTFLHQPLLVKEAELITVQPGTSLYALTRAWQSHGWIKNKQWLRWLLWQQPSWSKLQAGTYQLQPGWTLAELLTRLISGQEHQFSMTFVEGSRWREWKEQLVQAPHLQQIVLLQDEPALLKALAIEQSSIEGWLYPDTYFYTAGTSVLTLLKRAHLRMEQQLTKAWQNRDAKVERHLASPYEALILASIIEKETGAPQERATIASVFHNRFDKRMRLQTDPTVIYGMGERFNGNITKADLRRKTPYNTYVIKGLPPTPIAMPGIKAIQAALQPEQTDYYYFVSRGDGSHEFATTLKEHNANVRRYILNQEQ